MESIYIPLPKVGDKTTVVRDGMAFQVTVTTVTREGDAIRIGYAAADQHKHGLYGSVLIAQPADETGIKLYKAA